MFILKIDDLDKKILYLLSKDSRLSMRELAKRVHLSSPSVTERVRRLESESVLKGYTIEIDYKKLGFDVECFIEVTVRNGQYIKFNNFINEYPFVEFCYRIAGKTCYIVKLRLKKIADIEHFINSVNSFASTETYVVISKNETKSDYLELEELI